MKPRVRVSAWLRGLANGVPDDAVPGDLVVGNRGAAALCKEYVTSGPLKLRSLCLDYAGNYYFGARPHDGCKMYDFSGGTKP